jgi:putative membrane protein
VVGVAEDEAQSSIIVLVPNEPMRPDVQAQLYLAVERTFLAWVRTGLAMMGFGFVVARFGLFLRELNAAGHTHALPGGVSSKFGTALVALGVVLTVASVVRYVRLLRRLESGQGLERPARLAVALGISLAVVGAAVTVYLLVTE